VLGHAVGVHRADAARGGDHQGLVGGVGAHGLGEVDAVPLRGELRLLLHAVLVGAQDRGAGGVQAEGQRDGTAVDARLGARAAAGPGAGVVGGLVGRVLVDWVRAAHLGLVGVGGEVVGPAVGVEAGGPGVQSIG